MTFGARGAALAVTLLLVACVSARIKQSVPTAQLLAEQTARETALAMHTSWTLRGRLGVANGHDSGSGSLEWTQSGAKYRFSVHAPVTGKTWVLSGLPGHAVLEGLREQPIEGDDAAALLERELGWRVPVAQLVDWARGARAAGSSRILFRDDGLPAEIDQDGWTVQYLDYAGNNDPPLPSKVFARKGSYTVRLAIRTWTLE